MSIRRQGYRTPKNSGCPIRVTARPYQGCKKSPDKPGTPGTYPILSTVFSSSFLIAGATRNSFSSTGQPLLSPLYVNAILPRHRPWILPRVIFFTHFRKKREGPVPKSSTGPSSETPRPVALLLRFDQNILGHVILRRWSHQQQYRLIPRPLHGRAELLHVVDGLVVDLLYYVAPL